MSRRLPTDLMLMESYAQQITALCMAALESLDGTDETEREAVLGVAAMAGALGERVETLRRRHPLPPQTALPGFFA